MEAPGADGRASDETCAVYVVRIDTGTEKGHVAVGVVFTELIHPSGAGQNPPAVPYSYRSEIIGSNTRGPGAPEHRRRA